MSKSSLVDDVLKTYEDPDVLKGKEIANIVEQIEKEHKVKISPSLVYKRIKRLTKQGVWKPAEAPIPKPAEPIINIESEEPVEIKEEAEEKPPEPEAPKLEETKPLEEPEPLVEAPPTEEPEEEEKPEITAKDIEDLSEMLLSRVNSFTGWDGWSLTEEEKNRWCPRCAEMINKYAPDLLTQYFPEITFAVMTVSIVGGKIASYRKWKGEQDPEEEKEQPSEEEEPEAKPKKEEPKREKTREEREAPFRKKIATM